MNADPCCKVVRQISPVPVEVTRLPKVSSMVILGGGIADILKISTLTVVEAHTADDGNRGERLWRSVAL